MRASRLNPEQLNEINETGPNKQLVPLSSVASIQDKTVPRSFNRFQQMNAVKLSGLSNQLEEALTALETATKELARRATLLTIAASRASTVPRAESFFPP